MRIDSVRFGSTFRVFSSLVDFQPWVAQLQTCFEEIFCHQFLGCLFETETNISPEKLTPGKGDSCWKAESKRCWLAGGLLTDIPSYTPED